MAKIINGKEISLEIKNEVKQDIAKFTEKGLRKPGLTVIIVGEDPASKIYVRNKGKTSKELGINSEIIELPAETTEAALLEQVNKLNNNDAVDGILVQLPLPEHIDENKVINAIKPDKDVDGFHPINTGNLLSGQPSLISCTPYGIIKMLEKSNIDIEGKEAVIVGRSNIVGKPVSLLLLQRNATVTICHSRTKDLKSVTKRADILVAAVGKAELIEEDWIKESAIIIDVGINRNSDGKLVGDVNFKSVENKASAITPVPGGVGPMTIAMLMYNTLEAYKNHIK